MTHLQVQNGTEILDINIISVDNRCVSFVVNDDLSVSMKVPVGMSREMAEKYVRINEDRIWREYEWRKKRNHQALPVTLELEDGRIQYYSGLMLPFLGNMDMELRVKYLSQGEDTDLYVEERPEGGQILTIRTDNVNQRFLRYCVMRYYKKCAADIIEKKTADFGKKMHLKFNHVQIAGKRKNARPALARLSYKNIEIKDQRTLWGSCNRKKCLSFDWRIIMLPVEIIDYIIVHELAHLKKMNHSASFWTEVEKIMPEYRECQNWLNKHGKEYEIF